MIAALPGVFCAGEMLDWEAPTGGYLLTACLASGRVARAAVLDWLRGQDGIRWRSAVWKPAVWPSARRPGQPPIAVAIPGLFAPSAHGRRTGAGRYQSGFPWRIRPRMAKPQSGAAWEQGTGSFNCEACTMVLR